MLILDFGSQYAQLIARRVRECHVYAEIVDHAIPWARIQEHSPRGVILSGGPASVLAKDAPLPDPDLLSGGIPVLGICYGMQAMAMLLAGQVDAQDRREYGPSLLHVKKEEPLFVGLPRELQVWMSHGDRVSGCPLGFDVLAVTDNQGVGAMGNGDKKLFGVQFHPEVIHTAKGRDILDRFLRNVCGCSGDWRMSSFIDETVKEIRARVGKERRVLCALSGGVDSAVTAALCHRAIGDRLYAMFVDNGLLRWMESDELNRTLACLGMNLCVVEARQDFVHALKGVEDPEEKRKIIGKTFIDVFARESIRLGKPEFLAQGTLYPDVIESKPAHGGPSAKIKSHHNVGGLPEKLGFELIEPLRYLFKDEVRELGGLLGLPEFFVRRQPFPGPGLAVRILGEVTEPRLDLVRKADAIVREETERAELDFDIWQAFVVLLPVKTVGVMGDERTYENAVVVRVVTSEDGMTADWARLPHDLMSVISTRLVNEVQGINRVVYDITTKPPGTIEWE